jgi:hypothetical protein
MKRVIVQEETTAADAEIVERTGRSARQADEWNQNAGRI